MINETIRFLSLKDTFQVTLTSNASTGFIWKLDTADNFEVVQTSQAKPFDPQTMGVGCSTDTIYTVKPKRTGELNLRFSKGRPWEKNSPPVQVYEEIIMVSE